MIISRIGFISFCGFLFFSHIPPHYISDFLVTLRPVQFFGTVAIICSAIEFVVNPGYAFARLRDVFIILVIFIYTLCVLPLAMDVENSQGIMIDYLSKSVSVLLMIVLFVNSQFRLKIVIIMFAVGALYIAINVIFNFDHGGRFAGRVYGRSIGVATDPNDIALVMVYTIPLAFSLFFCSKNIFLRLIDILVIFILYIGLVYTYSRGGFLGLVSMVISATYLFYRYVYNEKKGIVIVSILMLSVIMLRYMPQEYIWRMQEIVYTEADGTGSADIRSNYMKAGTEYMLTRPFSKVGVGNSGLILRDKWEEPGQIKEKITATGNVYYVDTYYSPIHSLPIQMGVEIGLIPLILFSLFTYKKLKILGIRIKCLPLRECDNLRAIGICILSSAVGMLMSAFFLPVWFRFYYYFVIGLVISASNIMAARDGEHDVKMSPS